MRLRPGFRAPGARTEPRRVAASATRSRPAPDGSACWTRPVAGVLYVLRTGVGGRRSRHPGRDCGLLRSGYDFDRYRHLLWRRGIELLIAWRGGTHGSGLGKVRCEHTFVGLHQYKRLRTRQERRAAHTHKMRSNWPPDSYAVRTRQEAMTGQPKSRAAGRR